MDVDITVVQLVFGIFSLATIGVLLAIVVIQQIQSNGKDNLIARLTDTVDGVAQNPTIMEAVEPLAKSIPPEVLAVVLDKIFKGMTFVKTFTPDDVDKLIDSTKNLIDTAVDTEDVSKDGTAEGTVTIVNEQGTQRIPASVVGIPIQPASARGYQPNS